ncbi:MAG: extracellular solute-binding protein, partial [Trebonia sp.]
MTHRKIIVAMAAAVTLLALTACGSGNPAGGSGSSASSGGGSPTLTLYNGQHESTTKLLVADFTKATGIKVNVRSAESPALAQLIVQEGAASPADVFYSENSPALQLLAGKGRFAKLDAKTLAQIPQRYRSPKGLWIGVAARETVLVYNPAKLPAGQIPASLLGVGGPSWHGKIGIAPPEGDFQA